MFQALRMKSDDGTIAETEFLAAINEQSKDAMPFSKEELDSHVRVLCDEGKAMKCDGTIYVID